MRSSEVEKLRRLKDDDFFGQFPNPETYPTVRYVQDRSGFVIGWGPSVLADDKGNVRYFEDWGSAGTHVLAKGCVAFTVDVRG